MEAVVFALAALFGAALVVGMTVRAIRAPRGRRAHAAFGPLMSAGETYQELHTGQRGLQDSVIESIAEQEQRPSRTDAPPTESDPGARPARPTPAEMPPPVVKRAGFPRQAATRRIAGRPGHAPCGGCASRSTRSAR